MVGETSSVSGIARTFQAVNYDQFRGGLAGRALRMDENADAGLGVIQFGFHRKTADVRRTGPVISRDGEEMRILKKRGEWPQHTILRDSGIERQARKKRADKETALGNGHKTLLGSPADQLCDAAVVRTEVTCEKIVLMLLATFGMMAPAATATKPAISAYSMRSWPRVSFQI